MVIFQVGTGVSKYNCDASIVGETNTFVDYGDVLVYVLYRMESCAPVPEGDIIWYYGSGGTWTELTRWHCPSGYYGYAYCYITITNGAGWNFKATFQGRTVYFSIVPPSCTQSFLVREGIGNPLPIPSALVSILESPSPSCQTGSQGRCSVSVYQGRSYTAKITKTGYKSVNHPFYGCVGEIPIYLDREVVYCTQRIKIIDINNPIQGASVYVPTVGTFTTNVDGICEFNLVEKSLYTITITKLGYQDASDSFTACTSERTIVLELLPDIVCYKHIRIYKSGCPWDSNKVWIQVDGDIACANTVQDMKNFIDGIPPISEDKWQCILELCRWINSKGPAMLTVPNIFELIDSYLFNAPPTGYSFIPTITQIFGVIDYYLGFDGDAKTGCDFI